MKEAAGALHKYICKNQVVHHDEKSSFSCKIGGKKISAAGAFYKQRHTTNHVLHEFFLLPGIV